MSDYSMERYRSYLKKRLVSLLVPIVLMVISFFVLQDRSLIALPFLYSLHHYYVAYLTKEYKYGALRSYHVIGLSEIHKPFPTEFGKKHYDKFVLLFLSLGILFTYLSIMASMMFVSGEAFLNSIYLSFLFILFSIVAFLRIPLKELYSEGTGM